MLSNARKLMKTQLSSFETGWGCTSVSDVGRWRHAFVPKPVSAAKRVTDLIVQHLGVSMRVDEDRTVRVGAREVMNPRRSLAEVVAERGEQAREVIGAGSWSQGRNPLKKVHDHHRRPSP